MGEYTIDIFKASLRDLGWRVNETIDIDERWADADASRLAPLASELVQLRPDVIACTGASEAKALQSATREIPVVFLQVADPISSHLVREYLSPGRETSPASRRGLRVRPETSGWIAEFS